MAVDMFLKIDGIEGESIDSKHSKEIEILSYSFGVTQQGRASSGTGGTGGKADFHDFSFSMYTNKSSPKLWLNCANGKHIPSAVLTVRKAGEKPQDYMTYTFTDLIISSYQTGGSGGADLTTDSITFNFAKLEYSYSPQKKDGTLEAAIKTNWDVKTNQSS